MKTIFVIALCFCASFAQAGSGFANLISGSWRGVGVQDGADNWLILLEVNSLEARAEYPDFPCGATWAYGLELGRSLSAVEHLTHGQKFCANQSHLVIESPTDDQIFVSWTDAQGAEIGFAVLHRNDPALNNRTAEQAATNMTRMTRNLGLRGNPACLPATS